MNLKDVLFGGSFESRPLGDVGLMLLRGFAGLALAFGHGLGKLQAPEKFLGMLGGLGIPFPGISGWLAILTEFFGGILLALGLLTRPTAFFILCVMLTAFFSVHINDPFQKQESALIYGFIALAFLIVGSGRYGFDALIRGGRGR
jgi:putative oxidoreductase